MLARLVKLRLPGIQLLTIISLCLLATSLLRAQTVPPTSTKPTLATPERIPADLSKDPHLDRQVSLHEVEISFYSLLQKVSNADTKLTVETDGAEQKLHIHLKQRSLRQLMRSLADLLPGNWYALQDESGYRFEVSPKAIRRRRRWWELYLQEREKAFAVMRAAALQAMRANPSRPPGKLVRDGSDEDGIHESLWREEAAQLSFYGALPPALQEQIANQLNDAPWFMGTSIMSSSDMDEGATVIPFRSLPVEAQAMLNKRVLPDPQGRLAVLDDGYALFENTGSVVRTKMIALSGKLLCYAGPLSVPIISNEFPIGLNHNRLAQEVKKRGKDAPFEWKELAAYQESRFWANDVPAHYQRRGSPDRINTLEWLAAKANVEFVSDYYSTFCGPVYPKTEQLTRPLKEELDWQAQAQDMSWRRSDNDIYLFRNNRWYRDDLLEVPTHLIKRWLAYKAKQTATEQQREKAGTKITTEMLQADFLEQMDQIAEEVSALTPWQLFNGLRYLTVAPDQLPLSQFEQWLHGGESKQITPRLPFKQDVEGIATQYRTLLFYAALDKEGRKALLNGRLNVALLNPSQRQQAGYLLPLIQVAEAQARLQSVTIGIRLKDPPWSGMPSTHLVLTSSLSSR